MRANPSGSRLAPPTSAPSPSPSGNTDLQISSPDQGDGILFNTSQLTAPAGARVTLSCRGFAPSEQVEVTFGATVLATPTATAGGQVAASFAVPSGFAGSHYPGRKDTFQAKGRQSGKVASATFTVTG